MQVDTARAEETYHIDDPFASIDGQPIFLGELNLVLVDRLKLRDVGKANPPLRQAIAATLVRQHLAMRSLRNQGKKQLQQLINQHIASFEKELKRRGSSLQQYAKQRSSNEPSLRNSLSWQVAWRGYLKSRLTEANLKTYFSRNREKYAGGRWDVSQIFLKVDLSDQNAVSAISERLAKLMDEVKQSDSPTSAFAAAARSHSQGGSADEGGHVGWVQKDGDLPSVVMAAVRSTSPGKTSDVIRSPLGLHVVFVHQHETSDQSYEQLADHAQLRRDAADALFAQLVAKQKDAKVSWYIADLKPPANVSLIPQ